MKNCQVSQCKKCLSIKNSLHPNFSNAKQTLLYALHLEQTLIAAQVSLSKLVLGAGALTSLQSPRQ